MKSSDTDREQDVRQKLFIDHLDIDTGNWCQVFSACLGKMTAIQIACGEQVVRGQAWTADFSESTICFGNKKYPLQFIGSESTASNTWLWGWKNINGFSEEILHLVRRTKAIGERWKLEPLVREKFALGDMLNGHNLSIVTCGLAEKYCYYRIPHDGGAIFVAFSGLPEAVFGNIGVEKFIAITTQCIQQFPIDQKLFVESFLLWNNTKYEWNNRTLTAYFKQNLKIDFEKMDGLWRVCSMNTVLTDLENFRRESRMD